VKKHKLFITSGFALLLAALVLAACSPQAAPLPELTSTIPPSPLPSTPTSTTASPTTSPVVLEIVGLESTVSLTLEELKALPATEGYAGIKSSTGKITPPVLFKGVSLADLAELVGGMDAATGFNIVAEDGYSITFSFDQVTNGAFIAYDPATGNELKNPVALTAMLAYEVEGQPLDAKRDGTLRLVIISPDLNQVTDGHWSVKWVNRVEAKALVLDWTITAHGGIDKTYDRATIESCGSPQCHGAVWTDQKAQNWVGVPLWYFVGGIDDEIEHEGPAFNDALADAGYKVELVAADGYTVTFDAARVKRNNDIIMAYKVNENPLPDQYFPLRLVGTDLQEDEMVGMVVEISLALPAVEISLANLSAEEATFIISGLVEKELFLNETSLRTLEVITITAEHPKKGAQEYSGIALNTLLNLAGVKDGAKSIVLTAGDGYTAEITLAELQACANCLLAFTEITDEFTAVMPGFDSNAWVKNLVKVEVK